MALRQLIIELLNSVFRLRGMELGAVVPDREKSGMGVGVRRLREWTGAVGTVIDVGAASGRWTREALQQFKESHFFLVEPLSERAAELQSLCEACGRAEFALAVAGSGIGETNFRVSEDLDGSGVSESSEGTTRRIPVTTLDNEVVARALRGPFVVKLDTHGFELPILKGARETLRQTVGLIIEAYNFDLTSDSLRFHELCRALGERGFRVVDLLDPLRRPTDSVLWQMDLVFLRNDHPVFGRKQY